MISKILKKNTDCNKKRKCRIHSLYDYVYPAIQQSEDDANNIRNYKNWNKVEFDGCRLPGTQEPRESCGEFKTIGCCNAEEHKRKGYGDTTYVNRFKSSCKSPHCKECVPQWIAREAIRATKRLEKFAKTTPNKAIHVILSPPREDHVLLEKKLHKKANKILKEVNLKGGALIFHPWRLIKEKLELFEYPHFHFIGFGWLRNLKLVATRYGWRVIYKGKRKTILGTFTYLLSHAGVKKGRHSVTWVGEMSYGKLKIDKRPNVGKCPACGRKLVPIYYVGKHPPVPPDKPFEGFVDAEGWYEVKTLDFDNKSDYKFEYDSRKETNEILKSLAIS